MAVTIRLKGVVTEEVALVVSQVAELATVKAIPGVPEVAFAIASVCVAGLAPPCVKLKLNGPAGVTVTLPPVPWAAKIMLTVATWVLDPDVKVSVPLHVVADVIPAGLTETEKLVAEDEAVKKPTGEIVSQFWLVQVCSDAVTEALVEFAAVTVRVCAGGVMPLATALNVNPEVLRVNGPAAVPPFTTRTTG